MSEIKGVRLKTIFFAFYTGFPPTGGASAVTYQIARHWPGERLLLQLGADAGSAELEPRFRVATLRFGGGGRLRKLLSIRKLIKQMGVIARDEAPDLLVLEGASWIAYIWLLMRTLRQRLPRVPIIYHGHNVEYELRRQKHSLAIAKATKVFERRVLREATIATAVSVRDQELIHRLYGLRPLVLHNGVDVRGLRTASASILQKIKGHYGIGDKAVLFMGSYAYRPNKEAIDFLVRDVFPDVVSRCPEAQLVVIGGDVPYQRPWLISPGLVPSEELPAIISAVAVSVAPIFSGSGTRLKIAESLVAGTPVVTSPKGKEGLPIVDDSDLATSETPGQFVDRLSRILADGGRAERHAQRAAMNTLREALDWNCVVREFSAKVSPIVGVPKLMGPR